MKYKIFNNIYPDKYNIDYPIGLKILTIILIILGALFALQFPSLINIPMGLSYVIFGIIFFLRKNNTSLNLPRFCEQTCSLHFIEWRFVWKGKGIRKNSSGMLWNCC